MTDENSNTWERKVLEKVALAAIQEQRKARLWGIFFKSLGFLYLMAVFFVTAGAAWRSPQTPGKHTAVIDIDGVIAADTHSNSENIIKGLNNAYKDKNTQGIVLRINSPGGSPVQAGYINDEVQRLRKKYPDIPVYAVIQDICASGGYYIAVAADKIFVDKASMVGSIGVLMDGFGFTGTMQKLGVERRLLTAGENKGFLDPFSPMTPQQKEFAQKMLKEIHQQFIDVVKKGRGQRLKETPELFSGLVWTGQKSIELGLSDGLGSTDYVAREVVKAEKLVNFTSQGSFSDRLFKRLGASMASAFMNYQIELR
jgi:protease-4